MDEVVRVGGHRGRLPDADVTDYDGGADKVTADGCEVEGGDSENKAFQRTEFGTAELSVRTDEKKSGALTSRRQQSFVVVAERIAPQRILH